MLAPACVERVPLCEHLYRAGQSMRRRPLAQHASAARSMLNITFTFADCSTGGCTTTAASMPAGVVPMIVVLCRVSACAREHTGGSSVEILLDSTRLQARAAG
eukprot:5062773-Prymnesium_polylepis.2